MTRIKTVKGLATVLLNLKKQSEKRAAGVSRGLRKAGLRVQRASQEIVPIKFDNLRPSAFTRFKGTGFDTIVAVGYTVAYAIFVHENLDARHAPGKKAKFLEEPLRELQGEILKIVKKEAEI